jgi:3-oxoacyl-[acyl-carrier-protein] synthase-3
MGNSSKHSWASANGQSSDDTPRSRHAAITGWGFHVPEKTLTNRTLEELVDTNDEWIRMRTGISERRIVSAGETTGTLATEAALRALECARLAAGDLDMVICASTTPDHLLPATGCLVMERIGATRAFAFDLNSACTSFVSGLIVGSNFIQSGTCERVLVVASETLTRFVNWKDRNTCILFGDGAGAVVLEATDQPCGVLSSDLGCKGDVNHLLSIKAGCSARPATAETVANGEHYVTMHGNEVFRFAVRKMNQSALNAMARADVTMNDIAKVVPHQANLRIIKATQEALELPAEKVYVNVDRYGNTGAASIPIALCEVLATGCIQPGDNLLFVAFGGGLTWASSVLRWADVKSIIAQREERPFAETSALAGASSL